MNVDEYNQCVDQYTNAVNRFILKQIRDKDFARDIIQVAFKKMWRKLDSIDVQKSKTYLFTTAHHTLIDFTGKEAKKINSSEEKQYEPYRLKLKKGLKATLYSQ